MFANPIAALVLSVSLSAQVPSATPGAADAPAAGPRASALRVGVRDDNSAEAAAPLGAAMIGAGDQSDADTVRTRRKAVRLSEQYEFRRKLHKFASYATLPLFVAEYAAGDQLMKGRDASGWASDYHSFGAGAIAVLFGVNTVTGALNWWETRNQTEGRAWRTAHSVLMLVADAGFVATGALAGDGEDGRAGNGFYVRGSSSNQRKTHRAVAVSSMSVATLSYLMMLKPLRRD